MSLPSWERGLKYAIIEKFKDNGYLVAPFVGAWIEIAIYTQIVESQAGRSLRGSVD